MRFKYDPNFLIIDTTLICNQECFFCWRADRSLVRERNKAHPVKTMDNAMFRRIIDAASECQSMYRMTVCGPMGEPLATPGQAENGIYAGEHGFRLRMLNSNGQLLHKHDTEEILRGYNDIKISCDAADRETYKTIHGKDHFDQVIENVTKLVEVKKAKRIDGHLNLKFTQCDRNAGQEQAFVDMCNRIGLGVSAKKIHGFIDGNIGQQTEFADPALCTQPTETMNFTFEGNMTTCCLNYFMEPTFGHIDDKPLIDIWEGKEFETWRATRLQGICGGCQSARI